LDGVYRFSETDIGPFATYGGWTVPNTFEINYQHIGYLGSMNIRALLQKISLSGNLRHFSFEST
jgi:hypothetical protein